MPAHPPLPASEYRPAIDGLRAVAVLAVMLFHLNRPWLPGGFAGVDIFFVISGYLITSVILRDCERHQFNFGRFYQRRIARLLPAFFAAALATLLGAALIYSPQDLASTGATLSAAVASIANLKFLLQGNYFVLSPDSQPFLHCWSLSVEEQFYLLFPAAFLLLYRTTRRYRIHVLAGLFAVSLLCYAALVRVRPEWAFYLLPARAWELLAGSILANWWGRRFRLPYVGFVLIAISFLGGQSVILAVAGTACLLLSGSDGILSSKPLVLVGRMSYSLYLWHWPVFSLVDYQFYWQPMLVRITLKILVSFGAAAVSFALIEQPGRIFLNRPASRRLAFAALACSLVTLIPLGMAVRNANYVNADAHAIRNGGLRFNTGGRIGSMVLMGDSNGSMYGKMALEIARERDLKLDVISVEAGDPLPNSAGRNPPLWLDSLAIVKKEKPDFLVLVCKWDKLRDDRNRLAIALRELKPYAHFVFLITQPPVLPEIASREGIRNGNRPPFFEDTEERATRIARNELLKSAQGDNVSIVDIEPLFSREIGEILFVDDRRRQLYQDRDHLSVAGASLVKPKLIEAMASLTASR
jgi:peptidoglycan/LPS O-acetylase OafA/YrhL